MNEKLMPLAPALSRIETDYFTIRPIIHLLLITLTVGTVKSFFPLLGMLFFIVGCIALGIWVLVSACRIVIWGLRGFWRRACSLISVIGCAALPMAFLMVIGGDYLHLAILYPYYIIEVEHGHEVFGWGWDGNIGRSLVYDNKEKLKSNIGKVKIDEDGNQITVYRLVGNFYISEFVMP